MKFLAGAMASVRRLAVPCQRHFSIGQNKSVALPRSAFIEVSGFDTQKFLQGLCTNDLTKLNAKTNKCMPAAFLTPKGRIFTNTLVYMKETDGGGPIGVVLELNKAAAGEFLRYLTMYKLRSKVTIKSLPWTCEFAPGAPLSDIADNKQNEVEFSVADPRISSFGTRIIRAVNEAGEADEKNTAWYERFKLVHGLVDGPEIHARIPLECNLDLLGYVSFAKGCYVGQELTARTKFKGLVRKRLVPFLLARNAHEHAAGNKNRFDMLNAELKETLNAFDYEPDTAMTTDSVCGVGSRVYTDSTSSKSIGEVVHMDSTGTIGVAMIQQAALYGQPNARDVSDNIDVNLVVRKQASSQSSDGDDETGVSIEGNLDSAVSYISTYRPDWFHGLDEKTGNVQDL